MDSVRPASDTQTAPRDPGKQDDSQQSGGDGQRQFFTLCQQRLALVQLGLPCLPGGFALRRPYAVRP